MKRLRKRASSEAVRESVTRRTKFANAPIEEEIADVPKDIEIADASEKEMDMSDMMAKIKEILKVKLEAEKQAREDGRRVEKKSRLKMRLQCCSCWEMAGVKSDGKV